MSVKNLFMCDLYFLREKYPTETFHLVLMLPVFNVFTPIDIKGGLRRYSGLMLCARN